LITKLVIKQAFLIIRSDSIVGVKAKYFDFSFQLLKSTANQNVLKRVTFLFLNTIVHLKCILSIKKYVLSMFLFFFKIYNIYIWHQIN
jgi:hypothetical protein